MKKSIYGVGGLFVLIGTLFVFAGTKEASAEINVNINLGPPQIEVAEPPAIVLIPDLMVYFVPQPDIDIFFYSGYWWSPRGPQWYRSKAYNGPWGVIDQRYIPAPVFRVPKDYRHRYEKEQHIPYKEWKKKSSEQREDNKGDDHDKGHGKKGD